MITVSNLNCVRKTFKFTHCIKGQIVQCEFPWDTLCIIRGRKMGNLCPENVRNEKRLEHKQRTQLCPRGTTPLPMAAASGRPVTLTLRMVTPCAAIRCPRGCSLRPLSCSPDDGLNPIEATAVAFAGTRLEFGQQVVSYLNERVVPKDLRRRRRRSRYTAV